MEYLKAFIIGGILCAIGQVFIDKTKLTPARILVGFVVGGVILSALGFYEPLVEFAGAGATVPLSGFATALLRESAPRLLTKVFSEFSPVGFPQQPPEFPQRSFSGF